MAINTRNPVSTASIGGHPIHPILITLPIGFWVATLLADIGFWWTAIDGWATAALWLLGAAIVAAALAAVAGLIDFLGDERIRALSEAWYHAIGNVLAVLVSLFSFYWRYHHGAAGQHHIIVDCRGYHLVHRLEGWGDGVSPPRRRPR